MTYKEKIKNAKKRIAELEQLIKLWNKAEINQQFDVDEKEPTLTEIIMEQKYWTNNKY